MKQRLGIAQSFFHDPEVIFLDEPTDGVDPTGRKEIRELLQTLKGEGRTIFVNSHLLAEVQMMADRVAFIHQGAMIREGTVDELTVTVNRFELGVSPVTTGVDRNVFDLSPLEQQRLECRAQFIAAHVCTSQHKRLKCRQQFGPQRCVSL